MTNQTPVKQPGKIWPIVLIIVTILVFVAVSAFFLLFVLNRFELQIFLRGEEYVEIPVGRTYEESGAEARLVGSHFFRDGIPLDVEVRSNGSVDSSLPGEYEIYYGAMFRNMSASRQRFVRVVDLNPPRITLISDPDAYTIPGEPYREEGFSAWDDCDGDITTSVVREEKDGFVTYTVWDLGGNRTSVTRKIRYFDPIPPQITLLGETTVYAEAGENYAEPGWTAQDNVDGDLSARVEVSYTVDRYLAGSYTVTYLVKDSEGNTATAERTVVVQAKGSPNVEMPSGRVIYLTFDDGPGPYTRELLDILDQYDAKATFFLVNTDHADLIKDIADAGHAIGIHSMTHDYKEVYASPEAFFHDLLSMQQLIREKAGVETYLMRFPGGSSNTVSRFNPGIMTYLTQAVEDNGFCYFDWNVDSDDAGGAKNKEDVYDNVVSGLKNRKSAIVLMHDVKEYSVEALEEILKWGKENGYEFRSLDMTSPRAHHGVNN